MNLTRITRVGAALFVAYSSVLARGEPPGAPPAAPALLPEAAQAATGTVTLAQARQLAETHSARLAAAARSVAAAEGRRMQARLLPNPELEFEAEEFGGTGEAAGFAEAVTTWRLGQRLELGGKRAGRIRLAELDTELSRWDLQSLRLDVLRDVTKAFADVLAGQERVRWVGDAHRQAERLVRTVAERVEAGKVPALELTKAKLTLASRRLEVSRAERELATARVTLAATWGQARTDFTAAGDLMVLHEPPPFAALLERLAPNPDLARWQTETAHRERALELAKAERIPDVTVAAGASRSRATAETTFLISLSVPLPIFDRNQGAMREAEANRQRAADERRAVEAEIRAALFAQHQALAMAYQEVVSLREDVLPGAQQAFVTAREAYASGKAGYLEELEAEQTLFEVQMQHVGALAAYHQAVADVERLIGQPLFE